MVTTASLAQTYLTSPAAVPTETELAMLRRWIRQQWLAIPVGVRFTGGEFSLAQARSAFIRTGELIISTAHNSHPFLTFTENAMFRAVHDWHHIETGANDTLSGEMIAYEFARSTAPQQIWWMLFSEIVLQAAACLHHGGFQLQKLVRA